MIGRTPEYLGKKIEADEVKMAMLALLCVPAFILGLSAVASIVPAGLSGISNNGPHGFSEILYAYTSTAATNGSAFAGLNANTPFYNLTLAAAMFARRFLVIVPVLAIAGELARKKRIPVSAGTLPTHGPLFCSANDRNDRRGRRPNLLPCLGAWPRRRTVCHDGRTFILNCSQRTMGSRATL